MSTNEQPANVFFHRLIAGVILASGCVAQLPTPPGWVREGGFDGGVLVNSWVNYPEELADAAHRCQQKLYYDRNAAKRAYVSNTALTITGGSVSIAGGATAAIVGATVADESKQAKTAAVVSAVVGAIAGVVTLLSKAGPQYDAPLSKYRHRESHWTSARLLMDEYPRQAKDADSPVYRRAVREFNACASESPEKPVQEGAVAGIAESESSPFKRLTRGQNLRTAQQALVPGTYEFVVSGGRKSICKFYRAIADGRGDCTPPSIDNKWTGKFALAVCFENDECRDIHEEFSQLRDDFDAVSYSATTRIERGGDYYFQFISKNEDDLWFSPNLRLNVINKDSQ